MAEENITLGMIMSHMHGMESRLHDKMNRIEHRLSGRIDNLENRMNRMEHNLTCQIDAIDKRLDSVEIEELPRRVRRIEEHLGLAA